MFDERFAFADADYATPHITAYYATPYAFLLPRFLLRFRLFLRYAGFRYYAMASADATRISQEKATMMRRVTPADIRLHAAY